MTVRERRRTAMRHAFQYQAYREAVHEYRERAMAIRGQHIDAVPGSTSAGAHTDPTQQAAIRLVDMPPAIRDKALWVLAVNETWKDCAQEDGRDPHGLAYLFEENFRLTGENRGPDHNAEVRAEIMRVCRISERTFYSRLETVTDILVYHAAKRKLL